MNSNSSLQVIFAGTPEFAAQALDALLHSKHKIVAVYTQPDRPAGRGQKLTLSPVKQIALKNNLAVFQPQTLRTEQEQKKLAELNADVMIVVAYGMLLPAAILTTPHLGCINIHPSLLPRWRGAAPIQRAILAGDEITGITIMQMDEGWDTGPMLYKVECPIYKNDTSQTLHDRLAVLGGQAVLTALDNVSQINSEPQNSSLATYAAKISKQEAELDWKLSAEELGRKIRGFNPWPIAQTRLNDQILRIWEAEVIDEGGQNEQPGKIMRVFAQGIDVATGKKRLRLLKLQLPGGRVLPVADILNARRDDFVVNRIL